MTALAMPFEGVPTWAQALFTLAFLLIVVVLSWTAVLFVLSRKAIRDAPATRPDGGDDLLWVFLVPALDEELTIADSVSRLFEMDAREKAVLVIDDGSTDGTGTALTGLAQSGLLVLRRELPDARRGKAAALNAAWRYLDQELTSGRWAGRSREQVIVCVVDADGRLDRDVTRYAAAHFADPRVGGVQVRVRIYNRSRLLTWCQDVEFAVYGLLYQAGRSLLGTAGMGGNGQLNRLSALDSVAGHEGPWHDRLTEDQDLGLRLLEANWRCSAELRASVHQQGIPGVRRLLRQRTRWAQGNLQAMSHLPAVTRLERSSLVRLDLVGYLLMPIFQALVGLAFLASVVLAVTGTAGYWGGGGWWQLLFFFLLGYAGVVLGCVARGASGGIAGIARSLPIVPIVAAYSWLLWPALLRAAVRQLAGRRGWAKTAREPVLARQQPPPA